MSALEQMHEDHKARRARLWNAEAPGMQPSLRRLVPVVPTPVPVRPPALAAEPEPAPNTTIAIPARPEAEIRAAQRVEARVYLRRALQTMHKAGWEFEQIAKALRTSLTSVHRYAGFRPLSPKFTGKQTSKPTQQSRSRTNRTSRAHKETAQ